MRSLLGLLACLAVAGLVATADGTALRDPEEAAAVLFARLSDHERAKAAFEFDDPARLDWHFVPRERFGLAAGDLKPEAKRALAELLGTLLSEDGLRKLDGVRALEAVLREAEGAHRDLGAYHLSFYGTPGTGEPWSFRFEGHHLSLHVTSTSRELFATTPWFVGANPARVPDGEHEGMVLLGDEVELARELMGSLDDTQRASAIRAEEPPADVLFGPDREQLPVFRPGGLPAARMDEEQRALLRRLVDAYVDDFRVGGGPELSRSLAGEGLLGVHFLWMGPVDGERFYYRVQGESFLIELDVTAPNHVHALWRDREGDFGRDLLAEHRASRK